ncbi:MAG: hypothetical protein V8K32_15115 [Candidatus Electrothrix gigas]
MPINFSLEQFAQVSDCFCETGTYHGNAVIKALEAGFKNIATVEVSKVNQEKARKRIDEHPMSKAAHIDYVLGDAEQNMIRLVEFAKSHEAEHPVFWLDAHTHVFEDGTRTEGNECPLISEISAVNQGFNGSAILLIDDLRIVGAKGVSPRGLKGRVRAACNAIFNPDELLAMIKPGWGKSVDLLTILRIAMEAPDMSFRLLDGIEPLDVLCVYPGKLHEALFGQASN